MDAAEYKHVALGLIFLKYIEDAFNELYNKLKEGKGEYEGADAEDKNEYVAEKVFYVPLLPDGPGCRVVQNSQQLERILMMRWMPLKKIIHH